MIKQPLQHGFTILYAVIIVSMITAIGAGIFSLSFRQTDLLSVSKEVSIARNTTDRAIECLMYNDIVNEAVEGVGATISCDEQQFTTKASTRVGYDLDVTISHDNASCAIVSFDADFEGKRRIYARGFNTCGPDGPRIEDPRLQEYVYEVVYEGSSPFGRQEFFDTDDDDNTFTVDIFSYNGFLYVATNNTFDSSSTVKIYSLAKPAQPVLVSTYVVSGFIAELFVDSDILYVSYGRVDIVDISTPTNPSKIAEVPGVNFSRGIYKRGDSLYVTDGSQGLKIFDISVPSTPSLITRYDPAGSISPYFLITDDSYAYVCGIRDEFVILDISQLPDVQELDVFDGGAGQCGVKNGIVKKGNYLFAGWGSQGLRIFDISDPNSIRHVKTFIPPPVSEGDLTSYPNIRDVILAGDNLYIAGSLVFYQYDVSSPENPVFIYGDNSNFVGGNPVNLAEYGGHVYAANQTGGFLRYGPSDRVFTDYMDR